MIDGIRVQAGQTGGKRAGSRLSLRCGGITVVGVRSPFEGHLHAGNAAKAGECTVQCRRGCHDTTGGIRTNRRRWTTAATGMVTDVEFRRVTGIFISAAFRLFSTGAAVIIHQDLDGAAGVCITINEFLDDGGKAGTVMPCIIAIAAGPGDIGGSPYLACMVWLTGGSCGTSGIVGRYLEDRAGIKLPLYQGQIGIFDRCARGNRDTGEPEPCVVGCTGIGMADLIPIIGIIEVPAAAETVIGPGGDWLVDFHRAAAGCLGGKLLVGAVNCTRPYCLGPEMIGRSGR